MGSVPHSRTPVVLGICLYCGQPVHSGLEETALNVHGLYHACCYAEAYRAGVLPRPIDSMMKADRKT